MEYKKSFFNVEIEELENGQKLIYNTYSGIFGIMDKKTQAIYNDIENLNVLNIDDSEMIKNIDLMSKLGYIVNSRKDELATVKLERAKYRHPQNSMILTVAPTMDCNMRCPYCFEDKRNLVMSDEVQNQLVSFVKMHLVKYPTIKYLAVTWFGGEPLMQKEIIYNLSEQLIDLCKEKEVEYSAIVITNGALLDTQTAERLASECKVSSVQITIDGMRESHNKRRILINGEDSFGIITKNIESCKNILDIDVRVNVDKNNIDEVRTLAKYFFEERGWVNNPVIYLAPVEDYSQSCPTKNSSCLEGEQFAEVNTEYVRTLYLVNRDFVSRQFFPKRKSVFCAGEGMLNYVIDPEGYISNCYVTIGVKENRTGHISQPFVVTPEYAKWMFSEIPKECEKCEYLPMCMGGCGLHRVLRGGSPKCFRTYYTYKDILKLAYEDYITQKSQKEAKETATT